MPDEKEVVDFKTNVPKTVTLSKMFQQGVNKFGKPWFGYDATEDGKEKILFATQTLHEILEQYKFGTPLTICLSEVKKDGEKPHKEWSVKEAIFDNKGGQATPGPKSPLEDKETLESVRRDRKNVIYTCLVDALEVAQLYNGDELPDGYRLDHEDIRAMAISFAIDFGRRYGTR